MLKNQSQARQCSQQSILARQAMDNIIDMMAKVTDASTQIAATTEQQSVVANQITSSVDTIDQISQANTRLAQQVQTNGMNVRTSAHEINNLSATFQ